MKNKAFTLIELIFTIVIIGVLASVAIPKFSGLNDNSKISSELSTASSVQVAIDACHGEWIINEGSFTCGKDIDGEHNLTATGYPKNSSLTDAQALDRLLNVSGDWNVSNTNEYRGPASNTKTGVSNCKPDKPCKTRHWEYNETDGTFTLKDD